MAHNRYVHESGTYQVVLQHEAFPACCGGRIGYFVAFEMEAKAGFNKKPWELDLTGKKVREDMYDKLVAHITSGDSLCKTAKADQRFGHTGPDYTLYNMGYARGKHGREISYMGRRYGMMVFADVVNGDNHYHGYYTREFCEYVGAQPGPISFNPNSGNLIRSFTWALPMNAEERGYLTYAKTQPDVQDYLVGLADG